MRLDTPELFSYPRRITGDSEVSMHNVNADDRILEAELAFWPGVEIAAIEDAKKHRKIILSFDGQTRFVIGAKTRSDSHAGPHRFKGDVRKVCRELGATRVNPKKETLQ